MSLPDRILDTLDRGLDKLIAVADAAIGVGQAVVDMVIHRHRD